MTYQYVEKKGHILRLRRPIIPLLQENVHNLFLNNRKYIDCFVMQTKNRMFKKCPIFHLCILRAFKLIKNFLITSRIAALGERVS